VVDRCGRQVRTEGGARWWGARHGLSALGFRLWAFGFASWVGGWTLELTLESVCRPPWQLFDAQSFDLVHGRGAARGEIARGRGALGALGHVSWACCVGTLGRWRLGVDLFQTENVELTVGHHEHLAVVDRWNREADAN
jgi:hypothetical protein